MGARVELLRKQVCIDHLQVDVVVLYCRDRGMERHTNPGRDVFAVHCERTVGIVFACVVCNGGHAG